MICAFALSQYARQLSYLECRLGNSFKESSTRCDCEKILQSPAPADETIPAAKTHAHFHPDEFFLLKKEPSAKPAQPISVNKNSYYLLHEPDGVLHPPFQPPRCWAYTLAHNDDRYAWPVMAAN